MMKQLGVAAMALGLVLIGANGAGADDYDWDKATSTDIFNVAANWDPTSGAPPDGTDRAFFTDLGGAYTVNFDNSPTNDRAYVSGPEANIVTLKGTGSETYSLTRDDGLNRGLEVGYGHLIVEDLTIDVTDRVYVGSSIPDAKLTLGADATLLCDKLWLGMGGGAGTVDLQGAGGGGHRATVIADEIKLTAGDAFTDNEWSEVRVNKLAGFGTTPSFDGWFAFGTSHGASAASWSVGAGESLTVGGFLRVGYDKAATFTQSDGNVTSAGVDIASQAGSGGSSYTLSDGTLTVGTVDVGSSGASGTLTQSGGTIDGHVEVRANGTYTYSGGVLTGTLWNDGTINLNADLTVGSDVRSYVDYTLPGGRTLNITDELSVSSDSTLTVAGTLTANREFIGDAGVGSVRQTGGQHAVATTMSLGYDMDTFSDIGTYLLEGGDASATDVLLGDLSPGVFTQTGGTMTVTDTLRIGSPDIPSTTGQYTLQDGLLEADTIVLNDNGTLTQSGGTIQSDVTVGGTYTYGGGVLNGSLSNEGVLNLNADLTVGQTMISLVDYTLQNGRTLDIGDEFIVAGISTFILAGTLTTDTEKIGSLTDGTLRQIGGQHTVTNTLYVGNDPLHFNHPGTYELQGGDASAAAVQVGVTSSGVLTQTGGTLTVSGALNVGNASDLSGTGQCTLSGSGVLQADTIVVNTNGTFSFTGGELRVKTFTGDLDNAGGRLAPYASTGVMAVSGAYTQGPGGILEIEIGGRTRGDEYDVLDVEGAVALAGELEVVLIDSFSPVDGDVFDILDWGSIDGTFSPLDLPDLDGLDWDTSALYTAGELRVVESEGEAPIPEPAGLGLVGLAMLAVRKKRR